MKTCWQTFERFVVNQQRFLIPSPSTIGNLSISGFYHQKKLVQGNEEEETYKSEDCKLCLLLVHKTNSWVQNAAILNLCQICIWLWLVNVEVLAKKNPCLCFISKRVHGILDRGTEMNINPSPMLKRAMSSNRVFKDVHKSYSEERRHFFLPCSIDQDQTAFPPHRQN